MAVLVRSVAILAGVALWLIPRGTASDLFRLLGYGWILALAAAGAWAVSVALGAHLRPTAAPVRKRADLFGLAMGIAILAVFIARVDFGYKVMMDEAALTGTALGMHLERVPLAVARAYWIEGTFVPVETVVDKRPLLQPFLIATLHDLTGLRIANSFAVSAGAAAFTLLGVYLLGRRHPGPSGGCLALALFGGLPLFWIAAGCGGFDALNLAVLVLVGLLVTAAWQSPRTPVFRALLVGLLLTFTVRYETPLLAGVIGTGWLLTAWRRGWLPRLPWNLLAAAPALVAPWIWQFRIATGEPSVWQRAGKGLSADAPVFGAGYLTENLGEALAFLLALDPLQPNSRMLGLIGLVALVLWLPTRWRRSGERLRLQASDGLGLWLAGLGAITGVHLLYFWGQYTDVVTQRLSLPLHLLLAMVPVVLLSEMRSSAFRNRGMLIVGGLALIGWLGETLPELGDPLTWSRHEDQRLEEAKRQFIEDRLAAGEQPFVIGRAAIPWINTGVAARTWGGMTGRWNALRFHWEAGTWDAIYLVTHEQPGRGGSWIPHPGMVPPGDVLLETETVTTAYTTPVKRITIRRLTDLITPENRFAFFWESQRGRTDAEAVYADYEWLWLSQLP
ncbi:MAG: hypothetical protein ACFE0O_00395 [Opitutales bacterium]